MNMTLELALAVLGATVVGAIAGSSFVFVCLSFYKMIRNK
jgi:hypothetical protein